MKVTPRIEMLEEIICGRFNNCNAKLSRIRYWHNKISAADYSKALGSVANTLSTAADYLKELQKEVEK